MGKTFIEQLQQFGMVVQLQRDNSARCYDMQKALKLVEDLGLARSGKFTIDKENRFVYENFIRWCHNDPQMKAQSIDNGKVIQGDLNKGFFISGNTGSGKTWCLDIMRQYVNLLGLKIKVTNCNVLKPLAWRSMRADEICDQFLETGEVRGFKTCTMLAINDLGAEENEKSQHMGNRNDVLKSLLEARGDKKDTMTLITSNISPAESVFLERYGDKVQSRIYEMCNYFELFGKDRRKS